MFNAELFTKAKTWKQSKRPPKDEWMKKWYVCRQIWILFRHRNNEIFHLSFVRAPIICLLHPYVPALCSFLQRAHTSHMSLVYQLNKPTNQKPKPELTDLRYLPQVTPTVSRSPEIHPRYRWLQQWTPFFGYRGKEFVGDWPEWLLNVEVVFSTLSQ